MNGKKDIPKVELANLRSRSSRKHSGDVESPILQSRSHRSSRQKDTSGPAHKSHNPRYGQREHILIDQGLNRISIPMKANKFGTIFGEMQVSKKIRREGSAAEAPPKIKDKPRKEACRSYFAHHPTEPLVDSIQRFLEEPSLVSFSRSSDELDWLDRDSVPDYSASQGCPDNQLEDIGQFEKSKLQLGRDDQERHGLSFHSEDWARHREQDRKRKTVKPIKKKKSVVVSKPEVRYVSRATSPIFIPENINYEHPNPSVSGNRSPSIAIALPESCPPFPLNFPEEHETDHLWRISLRGKHSSKSQTHLNIICLEKNLLEVGAPVRVQGQKLTSATKQEDLALNNFLWKPMSPQSIAMNRQASDQTVSPNRFFLVSRDDFPVTNSFHLPEPMHGGMFSDSPYVQSMKRNFFSRSYGNLISPPPLELGNRDHLLNCSTWMQGSQVADVSNHQPDRHSDRAAFAGPNGKDIPAPARATSRLKVYPRKMF